MKNLIGTLLVSGICLAACNTETAKQPDTANKNTFTMAKKMGLKGAIKRNVCYSSGLSANTASGAIDTLGSQITIYTFSKEGNLIQIYDSILGADYHALTTQYEYNGTRYTGSKSYYDGKLSTITGVTWNGDYEYTESRTAVNNQHRTTKKVKLRNDFLVSEDIIMNDTNATIEKARMKRYYNDKNEADSITSIVFSTGKSNTSVINILSRDAQGNILESTNIDKATNTPVYYEKNSYEYY